MSRTGRPTEGNTAKNAPLNMRTSPETRTRLEQAADINGRSLTQEVERRLWTSFIFDDSRGGPHIASLANMICATIQMLELETGKRWMDDFETFAAVRGSIERLLEWRNPGAADTEKLADAEAALARARKARREADEAWADFRQSHQQAAPGGVSLGRGMFGSKPAPINRATWSAADYDCESALEDSRRNATAAEQAAQAEYDALLMPALARMAETEGRGRRIADTVFQDLGPRR